MVVGGNDGDYCRHFAEKALATLGADRFEMIPHCGREELNVLFNGADVALYTVPAISVFEVLGAGLPCILPRTGSLAHVTAETEMAVSYSDFVEADLPERVQAWDLSQAARVDRARKAAELFGWRSIAERLLTFIND